MAVLRWDAGRAGRRGGDVRRVQLYAAACRLANGAHGPASRPPEGQVPTWRQAFPYRHDADDLVTRREFLRIAIVGSGALFGGTVLLAVLDALVRPARPAPLTIARASALAPGEVRYFAFPGPDDQALLINRTDTGPVAFSQTCTHLSCAVRYERAPTERLYCPCHDGVFSAVTGDVVAGPPQRPLPRIVLERHGDDLVAVDVVP